MEGQRETGRVGQRCAYWHQTRRNLFQELTQKLGLFEHRGQRPDENLREKNPAQFRVKGFFSSINIKPFMKVILSTDSNSSCECVSLG